MVPVSTDNTSELGESLTGRIDVFENVATLEVLPLPSPSSVTVTIQSTDAAPSFGYAAGGMDANMAGATMRAATAKRRRAALPPEVRERWPPLVFWGRGHHRHGHGE